MKTLIAALIFGAIVLVPASVSAQSQFGPNEICQGSTGGLDMGLAPIRVGEGFIDNNGSHVAEILWEWDVTCGGKIVNDRIWLSNGQPVSTCDTCRAAMDAYRVHAERSYSQTNW